jgi:hypothetical protein
MSETIPAFLMDAVAEGCSEAVPQMAEALGVDLEAGTYFVATMVSILILRNASVDRFLADNKDSILTMIERLRE